LDIRNEKTRLALYKTMVRDQLAYCTQVWSPQSVSLILQIENVQRRATRYILHVITIHVGNIIQRETHKNWSVTTVVLAWIYWYRLSVQNACFTPGPEHPNKDNLSRDQGKQWNSWNYITYSPCKYINISKQFLLQIF
jgi:hypothetical protein